VVRFLWGAFTEFYDGFIIHGSERSDTSNAPSLPDQFRCWRQQNLSRLSWSTGFCPVASRMIHLDSDDKGIICIGLTVHDAGERVEIATDWPNRKGLVWLPNLLGHNSGTVATYIDCWCEFEGWFTWVIKIHKRLHRNAGFLSAQAGRLGQRFSFGPGGPTAGVLLLAPLEAMVLRDNGPLGYKWPLLQTFYPSYFFAWKHSTDNRGIDVQRHSDLSW